MKENIQNETTAPTQPVFFEVETNLYIPDQARRHRSRVRDHRLGHLCADGDQYVLAAAGPV
jgi:hypothetical protein